MIFHRIQSTFCLTRMTIHSEFKIFIFKPFVWLTLYNSSFKTLKNKRLFFLTHLMFHIIWSYIVTRVVRIWKIRMESFHELFMCGKGEIYGFLLRSLASLQLFYTELCWFSLPYPCTTVLMIHFFYKKIKQDKSLPMIKMQTFVEFLFLNVMTFYS